MNRRSGVVVKVRESGSEGDAGEVVLDEAVDVDDSGGAAELDGCEEEDEEREE